MDKRMEIGTGMAEIVAEKLGLSEDGVYCTIREKNNGAEQMALCIRPKRPENGRPVFVPFFYIDEAVSGVLAGKITLEEAASIVTEELSAHGEEKADMKMFSRDFILENCATKVISAEMNAGYLEGVVHRQLCDLAEVAVVNVEIDGREGLLTLEKWMLEEPGVGEQELFEAAHRNIANDARLNSLGELLGHDLSDERLYVLTNSTNVYGAALIACPEILVTCRNILGGDLYVIPSSVHEVILYRIDSDGDEDELAGFIRIVNGSNIMNREDVLSNHLYGFDENGKLYIVK